MFLPISFHLDEIRMTSTFFNKPLFQLSFLTKKKSEKSFLKELIFMLNFFIRQRKLKI